MGNGNRYGKYGEIKRLDRLRKVGVSPPHVTKCETHRPHGPTKKKPIFQDKVKIKWAKEIDTEYIRNLSKQVFSRYGPYDDTLTRWFLSGMTVTVLASTGKRPMGFVMLGQSLHKSYYSGSYEILAIAVSPEFQGLGIGHLLMEKIEEKAQDLKAKELVLHTSTDNLVAKKLFMKHGFVTSEIKKTFYPEGQDALLMVRKLT